VNRISDTPYEPPGGFSTHPRNKDATSSLCLFRWALSRVAEAAGLVGVGVDLRRDWRNVADHAMAWLFRTPCGPKPDN